MMRVGLQGYQVPEEERKDANLTFVIDVSGSMDMDNRLGLVKNSLALLVEQLHPSDTVSNVVYGTEARVVLEPTPGSRKGEILEAIYSLHPEGTTNAEAGIRLGYKMSMRGFKPDGINHVILCSDGVANVGNTGPDAILESIRGYANQGITLTSVGFGMGVRNRQDSQSASKRVTWARSLDDLPDDADREDKGVFKRHMPRRPCLSGRSLERCLDIKGSIPQNDL